VRPRTPRLLTLSLGVFALLRRCAALACNPCAQRMPLVSRRRSRRCHSGRRRRHRVGAPRARGRSRRRFQIEIERIRIQRERRITQKDGGDAVLPPSLCCPPAQAAPQHRLPPSTASPPTDFELLYKLFLIGEKKPDEHPALQKYAPAVGHFAAAPYLNTFEDVPRLDGLSVLRSEAREHPLHRLRVQARKLRELRHQTASLRRRLGDPRHVVGASNQRAQKARLPDGDRAFEAWWYSRHLLERIDASAHRQKERGDALR